MSTAQDRNLDHLHQPFRNLLERWLADVRAWCRTRGLDVLVYEVFRSAERQAWLYAQGRTREGAVVTYTLDSAHEYGVAVDWVPLRLVEGRWVQDWSHATYNAIYAACPPSKYGLERLTWEAPHLQLAGVNGADQRQPAAVWAAANGLQANVIVGSRWPVDVPPKRQNAAPSAAPLPTGRRRVFLRDLRGQNTRMDAAATTYGGQVITRLPDGRVQIGSSVITVYADGALQLDRTKT